MPKRVNTFTHFIPLATGDPQKVIVKNDCYFSLIFLGGNYLTQGSLLQRLFGGSDEVSLLASLRLQPDGLVITSMEEPNIVLDKRSIRHDTVTNIPLLLNILVKIPAYMDSIGFGFKIATTRRSDNFSVTLDVLNDAANKSVLESFVPTAIGKALGVGKVVKDIFEKLDAAKDNSLIQFVVNDFIIPSSAAPGAAGPNLLQEGYLVIFVKGEEQQSDNIGDDGQPAVAAAAAAPSFQFDDGFDNFTSFAGQDTVFLPVEQLEQQVSDTRKGVNAAAAFTNIEYDELKKILKVDGKPVINTYLVFKVQKDIQRGENLNAPWSKKYVSAVNTLSNEFEKTKENLEKLRPLIIQAVTEAAALLDADSSFTPAEKGIFRTKYLSLIQAEMAKFQ